MMMENYHTGDEAARRVIYRQARSLGYEYGIKMLKELGMLEAAVDDAIATGTYEYVWVSRPLE